jgi:NAD(P)-dependent dehydrogenase (short-subunit alcohol dehydrogenase family)
MTSANSVGQASAPAKRIFITGGASGLGRALAERAARDGYRVLIGDIHDARLAETLRALEAIAPGLGHRAETCDVRRVEDLERVATLLSNEWGGVDIIVNNAGIAAGGPIDEVGLTEFARVVDINLMGVVRGCSVFVPLLKRQGYGHIVNVASLAGIVHVPMMTAYNTAKAGVVALSETLRMELAPHGIHVSVVCPSFFRTNLAESMNGGDTKANRMSRKLLTKARFGADEIAARVWSGVQAKQMHVLPHVEGRVFWFLKRMMPTTFLKLAASAAAKAQAKEEAREAAKNAANNASAQASQSTESTERKAA